MGFYDRMANTPMPTPERVRGGIARRDPLDELASINALDAMSRPIRPIGRRSALGRIGGGANDWVQKEARQRGLPPGVTNVVYDQGPEQFTAQMKQQNRNLDLREKMAKASMANDAAKLELLQREDRRQDMPASVELDKKTQAAMAVENNRYNRALDVAKENSRGELEREQVRGRNASAMNTQDNLRSWLNSRDDRNSKEREGAADRTSREGINKSDNEAAMEREKFKASVTDPKNRNFVIQDRAREMLNRHPEYASILSIDDEGNPIIQGPASGTSGLSGGIDSGQDLRSRIISELYGDGNTPLVSGVGSAALGANVGASGIGTGTAATNRRAPGMVSTPNQPPMRQRSRVTGKTRISYDGGKTWREE